MLQETETSSPLSKSNSETGWDARLRRWQVEARQRENQLPRYATLFEGAPVGYAVLDHHGRILEINKTGVSILGRKPQALKGGVLLAMIARRDQRKFLAYLGRLRRTAVSIVTEVRVRRSNRRESVLEMISASVAGRDGQPATIRTVFSEVTAKRRIELQLMESQTELAAIVGCSMDAIISLDGRQRVLQFNRAAEEMFGCPAARAIGLPISTFIPARYQENRIDLLKRYAHANLDFGRNGTILVLRGERANGRAFDIEAALSQAEVGDEIRPILVLRDITERNMAENEILRLNAELEQRVLDRTAQLQAANEQLLTEAAQRRDLQREVLQISEREQRRIGQDLHDSIGQQLTGIQLLAHTLFKSGRTRAPGPEVRRISQLLRGVTREVHSLSRGLLPVAPTSDGLCSALRNLARTVSRLKAIDCRFRSEGPVSIEDNEVATHLFRIAQEAVHNALKHGRSKRISIILEARAGEISLRVRDFGRQRRRAEARGSGGLGLQIMKSRCEAIGGQFNISAVCPQGTRVECRIPTTPMSSGTIQGITCRPQSNLSI